MVNITEKDGIVTLHGEDFELKIDNNRQVYVKKNDEKNFSSVGEIEKGYNLDMKKKYLYNLYQRIMEKRTAQ